MITKSIQFCTSPKTKPVNKLKHFPINIICFPFPHFQVHCNLSHWLYTKIYDSASLLAPLPEMVWLLSSVTEIRALQTFHEGLPFKEGSCKMLLLKPPRPFISRSEVPMLLHLALLCNSPLSTVFCYSTCQVSTWQTLSWDAPLTSSGTVFPKLWQVL